MKLIGSYLKQLLFPNSCGRCRRDTIYALCEKCSGEILSTASCLRCGSLLDQNSCNSCAQELGTDRFRAICDYADLRFWIANCKREVGRKELMMSPILMGEFYRNFLRNKDFSVDVQFVPSKFNSSRYDHMFTLKELSFNRVSLLLKKEVIPQKLLKREERIGQKRNLFEIVDNPLRISDTVLLIDDVLTTGASLGSCISLLLGLGYSKVFAILFSYQTICSGDGNGYR